MRRVAVVMMIGGDAGDAEPAQRPKDAAGDFAPIGNEHLGEHDPLGSKLRPAAYRVVFNEASSLKRLGGAGQRWCVPGIARALSFAHTLDQR